MLLYGFLYDLSKWINGFVKYLRRHVFLATKLNLHNIFKHLFSGISVMKLYFFKNIRITLFISNKVPWQVTVKRKRQSIFEKAEKLKK